MSENELETENDDEGFIKGLKRRVKRKDPSLGREADWLWAFGSGFWKIAAVLGVLFAAQFAYQTYSISQAYPDPTEVVFYAQPGIEPGKSVTVRAFVREAQYYAPTPNASVLLFLDGKRQAEATTGEDGICELKAEIPKDISIGTHKFRVEVEGPTGKAEAEQTVRVTRSFRTMLSTDKPLYQPGQTIHMRALSLENDTLLPVAGRDVAFEVRDAKGNKVFGSAVETSSFGIAAADFKLANQVNEGNYTIAVTVGDTTSEREVSVETYTLPKFKIDLTTNRNFFGPRDTIKIDLDANYTFGKPIANAAVEIHAERFLAKWEEFSSLTGQTDSTGKISFELPLQGRYFTGQELHLGDAVIQLRALVTDGTGERRQTIHQVKLTTTPLRVEVFPESGELVQGVNNRVYFVAAFADGSPAKARIVTKGAGIVETNELGIAKIVIRANEQTQKIEFEAQTDDGTRLRTVRPLSLGESREGILLRTDRVAYRQGEAANLSIYSATSARKVFVDVVKEGRSFSTAVIEVERSRGSHTIDLPSDLAGTVQLQAYAILKSGRIVSDTKLIQVHRAQQLLVEAKLDAESYKPAETAMIEFLVKSKDGDPVEAALSLAAVDEAVFALNDARPELEEMVFLIQEELLKPRAQVTAESPADFTRTPDEIDTLVQEANVVGFAAAKGADDAPTSATGETIHDRWDQIKKDRVDHRLLSIRLFALIPLVGLIPAFLLLTGYSVSRIGYQPRGTEEKLQAEAFRLRMMAMFRILAFGILLFPILLIGIRTGIIPSAITTAIVFVFLFLGPAVWLTVIAGELRRLPYVEKNLLLFVRMIRLVPAIYSFTAAVVIGKVLAEAIDERSISDPFEGFLTFVSIGAVVFSLAFVLFLRSSLGALGSTAKNSRNLAISVAAATILTIALVVVSFPWLGSGEKSAGGAASGAPQSTNNFPAAAVEPIRVRKLFPETLLWQPQLVTDENGKAQIELELADSITTWRLSGSAVSRGGQLGSFQRGIQVFQDFFIDIDFPNELTQNDEVAAPIAIFNYLDKPQTIQLEAAAADWFEFVGDSPEKTIEIGAGEISSTNFRIRALKPGRHSFRVSARGTSLSDSVERTVRVKPDGRRIEQVVNGRLDKAAQASITIPANAVVGGNDLYLKVYPGAFSQVVEGMDSIFRMPSGCFEQTSSTTYPNVLVLSYLQRTRQTKPAIELKALNFIAQGYQRLISYEIYGGGFEYFGNAPANEILTAYGLMEFSDMAEVYDVDPKLISRTREWLISRCGNDGSFGNSRATAYIAWAIAEAGGAKQLKLTLDYLARETDDSNDAYALGVNANALLAAGRKSEAREILKQLSALGKNDGDLVFWPVDGVGPMHSMGDSLTIETTAIVVQAMLRANYEVGTAHKALEWLISKRDGAGTWFSTQATVQAMRALLIGAESVGETAETEVQISVNGSAVEPLQINAENADVFHLISLTEHVKAGVNAVEMTAGGNSNLAWQIVSVHYDPASEEPQEPSKVLEIETKYSADRLEVNDLLKVQVILRYNRPEPARMTLVDLGIPPGFQVETASLQQLLDDGQIERYEIKGNQVSLYLDQIPGGGKPVNLGYELRAKFPINAQAPPNAAWQFYEPEVRAETKPTRLTIE